MIVLGILRWSFFFPLRHSSCDFNVFIRISYWMYFVSSMWSVLSLDSSLCNCVILDSVNAVSHMTFHLLTPWSRVLLKKLTGSAASQEISCIFGIRRFLTVLTSAHHLSLPWPNSIQSPQTPPTSWRSILILSSHLRLSLPNGLFPSGFSHQNPVHTSPLPNMRHKPCPSHSSRFYLLHNIG
jgi:hypothetical protein